MQLNWNCLKTNELPSSEGRELSTSQIQGLVNEILLFWSARQRLLMDGDSEHKVEVLDDAWVLDSK